MSSPTHANSPDRAFQRPKRWLGPRRQEFLMLLPALVVIALFLLLPFIMSFPISLTNQRLIPRPVKSVSYTHLDVYKRQPQRPSPLRPCFTAKSPFQQRSRAALI